MATLYRWFIATCAAILYSGSVYADSQFEAYLDGLAKAQFQDHKLAGMTFVLVQGDEIVLSKGYGVVDVESGEPVDPTRHLFRPGSVSKLFTWTAVMQLVEQGRLDLNKDVSAYVPQFDIPNEFDQPTTLRHLMTHTPGLEDKAAGWIFRANAADLTSLVETLSVDPPTQVRAPGVHSAYSNWATALAGLIVANVSGQSFETYVQDHIFGPLDMSNATFVEPLPAALAPNMATSYDESQGALRELGFEFVSHLGPAGALSAAADDMGHFIIAHLNEGRFRDNQILKPATVALMHEPLFSHDSRVNSWAHGFMEVRRNGQRFIGHGGDTIAFHSELVIDPENRFGFFVSFNTPDGARARRAIVNGVIDYFYPPQKQAYVFDPLPGSDARIAEVVGAYRANRRSYTRLEAAAGLGGDTAITPAGTGRIFMPSSRGGYQYAEIEPYVFARVGGTERLVFTKDANGKVAHMLLGSLPIFVFDKMGPFDAAANHQIIMILTLLASLFVIINRIRNRGDGVTGVARRARFYLSTASIANLVFILGLAGTFANVEFNELAFDFPPQPIPVLLILPFVSLVFTMGALYYLWPVWQSTDCNRWASMRYSYVTILFVLYLAVLNYWHMLGWNY